MLQYPHEYSRPAGFFGGRPGAGKTTTLESFDLGFDESSFITINSDDIKALLPGYKPSMAGLFHEESSMILDQSEQLARNGGLNIIHDSTMRTTRGVVDRIKLFKDAGYRLEGVYIYASPLTSAQRSVKRYMDGGRYVPPRLSLLAASNDRSFDSITNKMDKFTVYNNNGSFVDGPILVEQGGK